MKKLLIVLVAASTTACATLTEDKMTPISMSFSDGSNGRCELSNKRGLWNTDVPAIVSVRKSDDALKYRCKTEDGREASGTIASEMGGKIIASAVFLDLGITDAITDKHRRYAASYVVPMRGEHGGSRADAAHAGAVSAGPAAAAAGSPPAASVPVASAVTAPAPAVAGPALAAAAQAQTTGEATTSASVHVSAASGFAQSNGCQAPRLLSSAGGGETWQAECQGGQFRIIHCDAAGCRFMQ